MPESDEPRFRRRLTEEPDMVNVLDEYHDKWIAQGVAQGVAQGIVDTLRGLVANGVLTIDLARQEIERLISKGVISEAVGREAIWRLR
jgi:6,7-dimethyl-8-ribityllumazine synthase